MRLATLDDARGGSAAVRLVDGEFVHLGRAARPGTLEAWMPPTVRGILEGGSAALAVVGGVAERLEAMGESERLELRRRGVLRPADVALLAPVPEPRLIVAAGLAYRSHLAEMAGTPAPPHPTGFMKSPTSISAPGATLTLPPQAPARVDYEGELAVVFGRTCHAVSVEDALDHVAGYTCANDLSARDWVQAVWSATQPWEARLTWEVNIMGKQLPGFTALGPVMTTADEVGDPAGLTLTTTLNGEQVQQAPVSDLLFSISEMIAHFSRWYSFSPGDVLLTGTPAGVGVGRKPPLFLRDGDTVTVAITKVGALISHVRDASGGEQRDP